MWNVNPAEDPGQPGVVQTRHLVEGPGSVDAPLGHQEMKMGVELEKDPQGLLGPQGPGES